MWGWVRKFLSWAGDYQTVQTLLQTPLLKTVILPFVGTVVTAALGVVQHVPLLWVCMGTAVTYAAIMSGLLRASEYLERKNPLNKLVYVGTFFSADLDEVDVPQHLLGNRTQRRANRAQGVPAPRLGSHQTVAGISRTIDRGQLGVEIRNVATYPISFFIENAETEVQGLKPPRGSYPKTPTVILAGSTVRVFDDAIEFDGLPCQRLAGTMDIKVKYGRAGREKLALRYHGNVDIQLETFGIVAGVMTEWLQ